MRALVTVVVLVVFAGCRTEEEKVCLIGGTKVTEGAANPSNACQVCTTASSTSAWSTRADGEQCGAGQVCSNSICASGCFVAGSFVASGGTNGSNRCQLCTPSSSTSAFTTLADGTKCNDDQVCTAGACTTGCFIDGAFVANDAQNPTNGCEACKPLSALTAWTPLFEGESCSATGVCHQQVCTDGCLINDLFVPAGPTGTCQACRPAVSKDELQLADAGTRCGSGAICTGLDTSCFTGCFIDGTVLANHAPNPANPCQSCESVVSTSMWTVRGNGDACGTGLICNAGSCTSGCFVAGAFVDAGALTAERCGRCDPLADTTAFTLLPAGTACTGCNSCSASGACSFTTLTPEGNPSEISLGLTRRDDTFFYGVNRRDPCCRSEVRKYDLDAGTDVAVVTGLYAPQAIALLGNAVFIADAQFNALIRAPLDGGAFVTVGQGYAAHDVISDATHVYFTAPGSVNLTSPPQVTRFDALGFNPLNYAGTTYGPWISAIDSTKVFFSNQITNEIRTAPLAGGPSTLLTTTTAEVRAMLVRDGFLYFTAGGSIFSMPVAGGPVRTISTGNNDPQSLVLDGNTLYAANYANGSGSSGGALYKIDLDAGTSTSIYTGNAVPRGMLSVDDRCVYFGTYAGPGLRRIDK